MIKNGRIKITVSSNISWQTDSAPWTARQVPNILTDVLNGDVQHEQTPIIVQENEGFSNKTHSFMK